MTVQTHYAKSGSVHVAHQVTGSGPQDLVLVPGFVSHLEADWESPVRAWRDVLAQHQALVRRKLAEFRGREVNTAGDGFLASIDGPARAVRCARAIVDASRDAGIELRPGLHTGECEALGENLSGLAIHIGARIAAFAGAGEVLVSGTLKDLVAGSGLRFADRGTHELRGVPGEWRILALDG